MPCYKTGHTQLSSLNDQMVITINFSMPVFQHSLLLVSGFPEWGYPITQPEQKDVFQNFEVFIGNDASY